MATVSDFAPIELYGSDVGVRVEQAKDGSLVEALYAKDGKGAMRLILAAPAWPSLKSSALPSTGSSLRMPKGGLYDAVPNHNFSQAKIDKRTVVLVADSPNARIEKRIEVPQKGNLLKVTLRADLKTQNPQILSFLDTYAFAPDGKLNPRVDATYAPGFRPQEGGVIGDHFFRSPVATVQAGTLAASVMPDLDVLAENRPIPTILDLDAKNGVLDAPLVSYGFADHKLVGHVYFVHDNSMVRPVPHELLLSHDILLRADAPEKAAYQETVKYQWERYGHRYFDKVLPQARPFAEYALQSYPAAFNEVFHGKKIGWFEHEIGGYVVGGMPSGWGLDRGWVSWQCWFNQLRSAWGLRWWGKHLDKPEWVDKANKMLNLALAAPMDRGAVPTTYLSAEKQWKGCLINPDPKCYYDLTNMAWKGIWMLFWLEFEDCPRKEEILRQCEAMASLMLSKQNSDGSIPTWLDKDLNVVPVLDHSAQTALPLWFISELWKYKASDVEERVKDLRSAGTPLDTSDFQAVKAETEKLRGSLKGMPKDQLLRGARFLAKEVVPGQYWYDFETFFSCSPKQCFQRSGVMGHEQMRDPHTLQAPQNTLAMQWAAEALMAIAELDGGDELRQSSLMALDMMALYQNVWPMNYRKIAYTYGGFGVQNSDGEYHDARQAQFGVTLCEFGAKLNRRDYFERGVAAVRAAVALVNDPLHEEFGIYPNPNYPLGLMPENCGHGGTDQQNGRTGFDWGEGSALASMAWLLDKYGPNADVAGGDVLIDGGTPPRPAPVKPLLNPSFDMSDWRMPGWQFGGNFLQWPVRNPRRFDWNDGGKPFIGTCEDGRGGFDDSFTGTISSPLFTTTRSKVALRVGGGAGEGVYVELLARDPKPGSKEQRIAIARGKNNERMEVVEWDVSKYANDYLRIRIVDQEKGGWGHINVGDIRCVD